jgi:hypothetical protein
MSENLDSNCIRMVLWQYAERCDQTSSCYSRKAMQLLAEFLVLFKELDKRNHGKIERIAFNRSY